MAAPPISFDALAKTAANPASGGYPYQLKGADLDKNFTFATEIFNAEHFTVSTALGAGGHQQRKVALTVPIEAGESLGQIAVWNGIIWSPFNALPATGTHLLGAVNGTLQWVATEEC